MSHQSDPIYSDLRMAIAEANDPKDRAVLLIMQRILARVEEALNDEIAIRNKVLNGLSETHHLDHAQLKRHLAEEAERAILCERTKRAVEWVELQKDGQKDMKRRALDVAQDIAGKVFWVVVGAVGLAVANGWWKAVATLTS